MANELGRNRKPAATKELEGNRSRRPIPKDWAPEGAPVCPTKLPPRAKAHFTGVCEMLVPSGVVRQSDGWALEVMARLWERALLAWERMDDDAACKIVAKWQLMASKFGLTPSDRQKLIATPAEEPDEVETTYFKTVG
jgi:phage terminase small subunit